jgi:hypothetical protein
MKIESLVYFIYDKIQKILELIIISFNSTDNGHFNYYMDFMGCMKFQLQWDHQYINYKK